jgi:Mg-chelatase subunit ChlD
MANIALKNLNEQTMKVTTTITALLLALCGHAQLGVSSGSYSMAMSNGLQSYNAGGMLIPQSIIVEDFVNYHKHDIAIPTRTDAALTIDYSNVLLNGAAVVQVGMATAFKENLDKAAHDVNIALVIDVSGSMDGNKITYVKQALKAFVHGLDNGVYLSLITFSNDAQVLAAAARTGTNRDALYRAIDNIYAGGSTNINAGMMLGYSEIDKVYKEGMSARLILLTDGMTNVGITDHEAILANSKKYNDRGIEISTIGVGGQLDFTLLRNLAENGRGSNHFIGDAERDIQKVFITELESLLYSLGKNPVLTVSLPRGAVINKVYGFKPRYLSENSVEVKFENLSAGSTQVVLLEVDFSKAQGSTINTEMEYEKNGKAHVVKEKGRYNPGVQQTNKQIAKNYSIGVMATALKDYADEYVKGTNPAKTALKDAVAFTDTHTGAKDEDVKRVYELLKQLLDKI